MIHNKCGGAIVMDCSSMYKIQSPSIVITTRGIQPGMVQIDALNKRETPTLMCSSCGDIFQSKDEFESEILETCSICEHEKSPSEIIITEYVYKICKDCIDRANSPEKLNSKISKDRTLSLYGQVLKKVESISLLTILMKK
jgi:hypothetical protein